MSLGGELGTSTMDESGGEYPRGQHTRGLVYRSLNVADTVVAVCLRPPRDASVSPCSAVKVIRNWDVLSVNSDSTLGDVFNGISTGQLHSPDGFRLKQQYTVR